MNSILKKNMHHQEQGAVLIKTILAMLVFLGFSALAVDVGYMAVVKNQLQNGADAAALAGARKLAEVYQSLPAASRILALSSDDVLTVTNYSTLALSKNKAAKKYITSLNGYEININLGIYGSLSEEGVYEYSNDSFAATNTQPNAVRVRVSGSSGMLFGKIIGINAFSREASAIASLSPSTSAPLESPIVFEKAFFDSGCNSPIDWNSSSACAGWTTLSQQAQMNNVASCINSLESGGTTCYGQGETEVGDTINIINGGGGLNVWGKENEKKEENKDGFYWLFQNRKGLNDGILDQDNDNSTWTTRVIVVDLGGSQGSARVCANLNQPAKIIGYGLIRISGVIPNSATIVGTVDCSITLTNSRGGGVAFNGSPLGLYPSLVK